MAISPCCINPLSAFQFLASGGVLAPVNQGLIPAGGVDPVNGTVSSTTQAYWNQAYWNQAYWNQAYWNQSSTVV